MSRLIMPTLIVTRPYRRGDRWFGSGLLRFGDSDPIFVAASTSNATAAYLSYLLIRNGHELLRATGTVGADPSSLFQSIVSAVKGGNMGTLLQGLPNLGQSAASIFQGGFHPEKLSDFAANLGSIFGGSGAPSVPGVGADAPPPSKPAESVGAGPGMPGMPGEQVITILPGYDPTYVAQWYTRDGGKFTELLALNGIVVGNDKFPHPWNVGQRLRIPATWAPSNMRPPPPRMITHRAPAPPGMPFDWKPGDLPSMRSSPFFSGPVPYDAPVVPVPENPDPGMLHSVSGDDPVMVGGFLDVLGSVAHAITHSAVLKTALDAASAIPFVGTAITVARGAAGIADGLINNHPVAREMHATIVHAAGRGDPQARALLMRVEHATKALHALRAAQQGDQRAAADLFNIEHAARNGDADAVDMQYIVEGARDVLHPDYREDSVVDMDGMSVGADPGLIGAHSFLQTLTTAPMRNRSAATDAWLVDMLRRTQKVGAVGCAGAAVGCP